MKQLIRGLTLLACLGVLWSTTGCRTDDELTQRPWNTPRSWETGLPSTMTEGR